MTFTLSDLSVLQVLVLLLPAAIPFAVDLLAKASAPAWLKSGLALFLACLLGAVQSAVVSDGERWQDYLAAILYSAVVAFVTHYTGVTNPLERRTARFGITSARAEQHRTARQSIGTVAVQVIPDLTPFSAKLREAAEVLDALDTQGSEV